jgi:hypothetical protein
MSKGFKIMKNKNSVLLNYFDPCKFLLVLTSFFLGLVERLVRLISYLIFCVKLNSKHNLFQNKILYSKRDNMEEIKCLNEKYVYFFGEGNKDMKELLGGKGANLE